MMVLVLLLDVALACTHDNMECIPNDLVAMVVAN